MKLSAFILLCLFLNETEPLQIKGIKKEYRQSESIKYSVCNSDKKSLLINIALEARLDNKWQEITIDVTRNAVKSAAIYKLNQHNCRNFSFNLNEIDKTLVKDRIEVRLKIYCRNKLDRTETIFYSNTIFVKPG